MTDKGRRKVLVLASLVAIVMAVFDTAFLQLHGDTWLGITGLVHVIDGTDG